MKMNLKAKDFADKENLKKSLDTLLKKPLMALLSGKVEKLPFCYEVDYFGPDEGFISIGVAKEVDKMFKTKRCKGQGLEGKIDKKKVAYGVIKLNPEGGVEFCVLGGMMKQMQAKKVIKSINILKKKIGDKFVISKGEADVQEQVIIEDEEKVTGEDIIDAGAAVVDEIKNLIKTIGSAIKDSVTSKVVPNVKSKKVSNDDMDVCVDLKSEIEKLKNLYDSAEEKVKTAVGKHVEKIKSFEPQLDKIKAAIEKMLNAGTSDSDNTEKDDADAKAKADQEAFNKKMDEYLNQFKKEMSDINKSIGEFADEVIDGGAKLLNYLFD